MKYKYRCNLCKVYVESDHRNIIDRSEDRELKAKNAQAVLDKFESRYNKSWFSRFLEPSIAELLIAQPDLLDFPHDLLACDDCFKEYLEQKKEQ